MSHVVEYIPFVAHIKERIRSTFRIIQCAFLFTKVLYVIFCVWEVCTWETYVTLQVSCNCKCCKGYGSCQDRFHHTLNITKD